MYYYYNSSVHFEIAKTSLVEMSKSRNCGLLNGGGCARSGRAVSK